jgi:transcription elongation factor Elf1
MKKKKRRRPGVRKDDNATYICDACGEEIVVPVDVSAGHSQEYVEDCPVCCRPNVIHVEVQEDGEARIWAERE